MRFIYTSYMVLAAIPIVIGVALGLEFEALLLLIIAGPIILLGLECALFYWEKRNHG